MRNYDFLNLSPYEFEALSRDLLQKHLGIHFESFGLGIDGGIDLRYAVWDSLVVQCKRYEKWADFLQNIKKELVKVRALSPERYLIVTSVSLLPARKDVLIKLFAGFIKSPEDIYGKEDLNNLLGVFPEVERSHFKLWFSSVDILQTILHSSVVNHSRFILEGIKEKVRVFVENESFSTGRDLLLKHNYLIISGIPGIGKTTLAQMLVFEALSSGFNEFIYISNSIEDAFKLFKEDENQVFLYDDFLGRNFLNRDLPSGEERGILNFIAKVQRSENKRLIFTTREYILRQAQGCSEDLTYASLVKCVVDISSYHQFIKGQILYNHFFVHQLPMEYLQGLLQSGLLLLIVHHRNYSPRIIEHFCLQRLWELASPDDFGSHLLAHFDSPFLIWEHAYEHSIDNVARVILNNLLVCGNDVPFEQLYNQCAYFYTVQVSAKLDKLLFRSAIKQLDGSFVKTSLGRGDVHLVNFQNPSIQDFLVSYLNKDESLRIELINSACFLKPLVDIFSNAEIFGFNGFKLSHPKGEVLEKMLINDFDALSLYPGEVITQHATVEDVLVIKLSFIHRSLAIKIDSALHDFIRERLRPILYERCVTNESATYFASLVCAYFSVEEINVSRILLQQLDNISSEDHLSILNDFENSFKVEYNSFLANHWDVYDSAFAPIIDEKSNTYCVEVQDLENRISELKDIERYYKIDTYDAQIKLQEGIDEINQERELNYEDYRKRDYQRPIISGQVRKEVGSGDQSSRKSYTVNEQIENLFKSL